MAVEKIKNYNIHQNPATNENQFDVENYLNENWNKTKEVVNNNADELIDIQGKISDLETDNTSNKQDISEIKQEQQTQNTDIKNLQTNDVKQDELISKLKNVALNAETEESKSLHVTDANKFGQLEVLGNHKQENRSGKNKLNLANIQQTTKNGITCTYNEDGSVTFNGTCTADNTSFVINNTNINAIKNQTTMSAFYEKGSISANEGKTAYIYARINTSDYSKILGFNIADLNNSNPVISEQYKFDDALLNQFSFRIESGTILNKFTVKIMITDTPEEATEYEQYGATPSPEYPSKIVCLGSNKNLYDGTNKNYYINISANSCGILEGNTGSIVDVKGKSNVTISSSIAQTRFRAGCINSEVTGNTAVTLYNGLNKDNSIEMTINCEEYNYLVINATDLSKIKVEEGTEATSYSSFGQGSTLISKINKNIYDIAKYPFTNRIAYNSSGGQVYWDGYCGILDYFPIQENAQYTFSNSLNKPIYCGLVFYSEDKQVMSAISTNTTTFTTPENCKYIRFAIQSDTLPSWVQIELGNTATSNIEHKQTDYLLYIQQEMLKGDYFVKESDGWKEVHGWNKVIFNGNENWKQSGGTTDDMLVAVLSLSNGVDGFGCSNYFKYYSHFDIGCFVVYNGGSTIGFSVSKSEIATIDEFKLWLQEKYNSDNPAYAFYKTTTTTKLPCTKEQSAVLEELNNLDLFEGVNNIITAEDISLLKLKYALDVKTYVDNKLNTINQQILEIVGGNG